MIYNAVNSYATIGLDARQFDKYVIVKTNQSAGTLFPVIYDTENPEFFELMEVCADANQKLIDIEKSNDNGILKLVQKLPVYLQMAFRLLQSLSFLPVIRNKFKLDRKRLSNSLKFLYLYYFLNNY